MATPLHIRGTLIDCRLCLRTSCWPFCGLQECAAILMCLMTPPLVRLITWEGQEYPKTGVNPLG